MPPIAVRPRLAGHLALALASTVLASACTGATARDAAAPASQEPAEAQAQTPEQLAARGLAAADLFPGLVSLCDLDMVFSNVNLPRPARASGQEESQEPRARPAGRGERQAQGPRKQASLGPLQVFDDLYFLGNDAVSAWLVGSEEHGYVLFDSLNTNAEAERDIIGGMEALGLDPGKIRRFIVSHGHGDHYGGHRYISERLGLPVTMSEPDWALVRTLGEHPRFGPAPVEGASVADGEVIRLGNTLIRIFVTSAHTPGTISPIITLHDNGTPHHAILWGGTGLNFGADEQRLRAYAASAARLREEARKAGVDLYISNHPARDGSAENMRRLASRAPGDPHPFVTGPDTIRVFDLLENCPLAQAERIAAGRYPGG
jgi:metallo-beta-lactamase class B